MKAQQSKNAWVSMTYVGALVWKASCLKMISVGIPNLGVACLDKSEHAWKMELKHSLLMTGINGTLLNTKRGRKGSKHCSKFQDLQILIPFLYFSLLALGHHGRF